MKRVVVISDLHCGHKVGLTHPDFDSRPNDIESENYDMWRLRQEYWRAYAKILEDLQPINILICNGDAIDGKGKKSGGIELLTSDRNEQIDNAVACIEQAKAEKVVMSSGTGYHTGVDDTWEKQVANGVNAVEFKDKGLIDVNGLLIDYRHFISSSSVPYSRGTAPSKEHVWNMLKVAYGIEQKVDMIIRSHVHYYGYSGGQEWLAITTPALQGPKSKFGQQKMSGIVDWGLLHFDIESKEDYTWQPHIFTSKRSNIKATKL